MSSSNLSHKIIVIIGSSSGLGEELARLLLKKGARLFLLSRSINKSRLPNGKIVKIICDVANASSIKMAFRKIDKEAKRIDVLINCAGVGLEERFEKSSPQKIKEVINTNLTGAILATKEGYRRMLNLKKGYIVNISSTSGKKARALETIYCASKWGLAGFSESLRLEAKEHGIRVTTVYPGGMKTHFYDDNPKKDTSKFMNPRYVAEQIICLLDADESITPSEMVIERN